jgi:hypothetical protein
MSQSKRAPLRLGRCLGLRKIHSYFGVHVCPIKNRAAGRCLYCGACRSCGFKHTTEGADDE